jgi:hypothetical protein
LVIRRSSEIINGIFALVGPVFAEKALLPYQWQGDSAGQRADRLPDYLRKYLPLWLGGKRSLWRIRIKTGSMETH